MAAIDINLSIGESAAKVPPIRATLIIVATNQTRVIISALDTPC